MLKYCLFHKVKKQEPKEKTTWDDLKLKGQVRENYLHRSILNCSEQDKTSFVISRDKDNASAEIQIMSFKVYKQVNYGCKDLAMKSQ